MKWTMIDFTHFIGIEEPYTATIHKSNLGWVWNIQKDGALIDSAVYHNNAPTSEVDCKVKADKAIKALLIKEQSVAVSDTTKAQ